MNFRDEFLRLLKSDTTFRLEVLDILSDDIYRILEIDVRHDDELAEEIVSVDLNIHSISDDDKFAEIQKEINETKLEHFKNLWRMCPLKIKKETTKKMFFKLLRHKTKKIPPVDYLLKLDEACISVVKEWELSKYGSKSVYDFLSYELKILNIE